VASGFFPDEDLYYSYDVCVADEPEVEDMDDEADMEEADEGENEDDEEENEDDEDATAEDDDEELNPWGAFDIHESLHDFLLNEEDCSCLTSSGVPV